MEAVQVTRKKSSLYLLWMFLILMIGVCIATFTLGVKKVYAADQPAQAVTAEAGSEQAQSSEESEGSTFLAIFLIGIIFIVIVVVIIVSAVSSSVIGAGVFIAGDEADQN
ncbi:hypothetical protein [Diplocloster agilis]|nr:MULTISPECIES: hypothetical protein [Lachnospiraceae]MCU6736051.1 hypothetical protein [Suonthocola fibrivorans]SCJ85682.1 Uncharacterised protein [uncultured Clostridium sp.]